MFTSLQITLFISLAVLIALSIYLLVRHNNKKKNNQLKYNIKDNDQNEPVPVGVYLVIIGVIIVIIVGFYFSVKRYDIAYQGIKYGHPGVAVAALSPEIGEGVADVVQSFNGYNYY
jgi:hypothetical protein